MWNKIRNFANNKINDNTFNNTNFNRYSNEKKKIFDIVRHRATGLRLCDIMLFDCP